LDIDESSKQWWWPIFAGGSAGIASKTVTAPLERIELMLQVKKLDPTIKTMRFDVISPIRKKMVRIIADNGYRGFWRGNFYACLKVFPFGGIISISYMNILANMPHSQTGGFSNLERFTAGYAAGVLATVATYPLDIIRARLAVHSTITVQSILSSLESPLGLYKGMGSTLFAMGTFVAFQQWSYDAMRYIACDKENGFGKPLTVPLAMSMGVGAAIVTQTVVHPFDTLRRRIQVDTDKTRRATMKTVLKECVDAGGPGLRSLYNGLFASYLKVMPAVAITITTRDTLLGRMSKGWNEE
jgi:hypothetical protein